MCRTSRATLVGPQRGKHRAVTNVPIDDELLARAIEVGGEETKEATVDKALREFVALRQNPGRRLLELFGTVDWDEDFDYKGERSRS